MPRIRFVSFVGLLLLHSHLYHVECARTKRCGTRFETHPQEFDVCRTKECIVFRLEVPWIWIDTKRMNSSEHQQPFPCSQYSEKYENLYGPFFDILKQMPPLNDSLCVWGGNDCTYDDMVSFVQRTTSRVEKYKFMTGGLLFNLRYRMNSPLSIPSVPLMEDHLIIIGPRNDDRMSWASAWDALWRPFTTKAWAMLIFTLLSVVFLRVWISYHFTTPFTWHHFRDNLLGDYIHSHTAPIYQRPTDVPVARHLDPAELRRLNSYTTNGVKMLFILVLLYYEIAVVDFVFQNRTERVDSLSPSQFVITENTTMEQIFVDEFLRSNKNENRRANRQGCRGNTVCWKEVHSIGEVFDTVTDRNGTRSKQHLYSYVYESFNRYWFKQNASLCQEIQVLEYDRLQRSFAGVWYYSKNIDLDRRTEIDRMILSLREKDIIRKLIQEEAGASLPPKCETSTSISVLLLGVPIFMFPGPIFTLVFFYMLMYTVRRHHDAKREMAERRVGMDDEDTDNDNDDNNDNGGDNGNNEAGSSSSSMPRVKRRIDLPYMSQITETTWSDSSGNEPHNFTQFETLTRRWSTH